MPLLQTPEAAFGTLAPDFDLPGTDGRRHTRDGSRGPRGLLVMFICNHCPYVKAIRERLSTDANDLIAAGIGVVAISSNDAQGYPEDSFDRMKDLSRDMRWPFAYLYDEPQTIARAYGAVCTPDFFGYDADLRLRYRGRLDDAQMRPRVAGTKRELVMAMMDIAKTGQTTIEQVPSVGCSIKYKR